MSASFLPSSITRLNTSEWISKSIAKSMVWSDFGLSCFDYPLNRKNRDTVCTLLVDLPFRIIGVWVVCRPINGNINSSFEHWCVKIQAPPALISIDFLESKKKGAFGLQQTTATDAELSDFLHYFISDKNGKKRKKWQIISSVTPSPLKNISYLKYMDDHELEKLKIFMTNTNINNADNNHNNIISHININRKVCDIADFLGMWTENINNNNLNKNQNKSVNSSKSYNPITANCQQFALDLFTYLVGHKKIYKNKIKKLKKKIQSPYDKKKYKINDNDNDNNDDQKAADNIINQKNKKNKGRSTSSNNSNIKPRNL